MRGAYSVLFLAQIVVFFQVLECAVYPSIHWSPQNPLFDNGDSILYVLPMSKLHIVCPNPSTIMKKVRDNTPKEKLYENLWVVSRDSYDSCSTDYTKGSRLLLRCTTPLALKYYTLVFQRYSAVSSQVFIPGREYYFIATSDGSQGSIDDRSGGNCKHKRMKLRIFVCNGAQDPRCNRKPTTTATEAPTTVETTVQSTILPRTTRSTTTLQTTNSTTTHASTEEVTWPTTSSSSQSTTRAVTWLTETTEQPVLTSDIAGLPVRAEQRSPLTSVSELSWTIMIPLMACLVLSIMVNIILIYRLKKLKQGYDLNEKDPKIIEANSVKHPEKDRIEPRVDRTWLLCRRSADITEV